MERQGVGEPKRTRVEYSALNVGTAMASQLLANVLGYATRIMFTRTLSAGYVGVSGLCADLLGILALSELGIANAMSFALYRRWGISPGCRR